MKYIYALYYDYEYEGYHIPELYDSKTEALRAKERRDKESIFKCRVIKLKVFKRSRKDNDSFSGSGL